MTDRSTAAQRGSRLAGKCGAKNRRNGDPCRNPRGWRTDHPGSGNCVYHGGASPSGKAAAKKEEAQAAAAKLGLPREIDPIAALEEELHRCAGRVAFYGQLVASTDSGELPADWLRAEADERDRLTKVATAMVSLGIEERRVRMFERAGERLAELVRGLVADLGHSLEDPTVQSVVRRHLLALEPGPSNATHNGGTT